MIDSCDKAKNGKFNKRIRSKLLHRKLQWVLNILVRNIRINYLQINSNYRIIIIGYRDLVYVKFFFYQEFRRISLILSIDIKEEELYLLKAF